MFLTRPSSFERVANKHEFSRMKLDESRAALDSALRKYGLSRRCAGVVQSAVLPSVQTLDQALPTIFEPVPYERAVRERKGGTIQTVVLLKNSAFADGPGNSSRNQLFGTSFIVA